MLALLNWFRPSHHGWTKLTTLEGVTVLYPNSTFRKSSQANSPLGLMDVTLYTGHLEKSNFSIILSIRDFVPGNPAKPEDYFQTWKDEFNQTMESYQIEKALVTERHFPGDAPRYELLYTNADQSVFTRVTLISQFNRLVILFAVGMLQEVSGPACGECFRSIRL